eukprot:COSAG01_NODE_159_length_23702_cov_119.507585_14_plen_42_part_00
MALLGCMAAPCVHMESFRYCSRDYKRLVRSYRYSLLLELAT